ncbi:uncharacterized protein LOC111697323 isoform X3 [Eurytemora carolleeae]|uniref:uncharacterized protein LOC111697323 isoform X3 n=1 Tax=Eurytemora carolleeae TaxID=1294199 RepID=UPI000C770E82|nr:uncharacterized protein LOC111697323 isoform X3 [Eurytemora carolleeae]|eukprot:XP_023323072.1 uncharacterized protein LOC111697323 isoform X3 [Eurytemora affinis]
MDVEDQASAKRKIFLKHTVLTKILNKGFSHGELFISQDGNIGLREEKKETTFRGKGEFSSSLPVLPIRSRSGGSERKSSSAFSAGCHWNLANYVEPATRRQSRSCSSTSTRRTKPLPESDLTRRSKPLPESDSTWRSKPFPESDSTRRPKPVSESDSTCRSKPLLESALTRRSDSSPVTELFESNPPPLPPKQRKLVSSVHSLGSQVSKSPSFSSKGSVYSVQSIPLPRQAFQESSLTSSTSDTSGFSLVSSKQRSACPGSCLTHLKIQTKTGSLRCKRKKPKAPPPPKTSSPKVLKTANEIYSSLSSFTLHEGYTEDSLPSLSDFSSDSEKSEQNKKMLYKKRNKHRHCSSESLELDLRESISSETKHSLYSLTRPPSFIIKFQDSIKELKMDELLHISAGYMTTCMTSSYSLQDIFYNEAQLNKVMVSAYSNHEKEIVLPPAALKKVLSCYDDSTNEILLPMAVIMEYITPVNNIDELVFVSKSEIDRHLTLVDSIDRLLYVTDMERKVTVDTKYIEYATEDSAFLTLLIK